MAVADWPPLKAMARSPLRATRIAAEDLAVWDAVAPFGSAEFAVALTPSGGAN
jgi:hypothetical protein